MVRVNVRVRFTADIAIAGKLDMRKYVFNNVHKQMDTAAFDFQEINRVGQFFMLCHFNLSN